MKTLRPILGDQLTADLASLRDIDPSNDIVLLAEVAEETRYVPHHRQKIVMVLAAMRHFARDLWEAGIRVDYVALDDPANTGDFLSEWRRAVARHQAERVVLTEPGEWRVAQAMERLTEDGIPVEIRADDRFFCSRARFARWAEGRRAFRMEFFYREMRRESGILMDGDQPVGGQWNFDAENRKRLPASVRPPSPPAPVSNDIVRSVIELVAWRFPDGFGDLGPFVWPVTRAAALAVLDRFIAFGLPSFGDYQDAMKDGEPFLFHALLSPALNIGLLTPREVCLAAEAAWRRGDAPLNAVEGFVRQILGWREYVRGIYWLRMPDYAQGNALGAERPLPDFYWTGRTSMRCVSQVVGQIQRHAYAHHIQRLMVMGNLALLAGFAPAEVEAWYLAVFVDAFEWVELPNTHGMALFADGGLLASKPYAASGAYINRMSDYCGRCVHDPKARTGPTACPFTVLYWHFLMTQRDRLASNPRMAMAFRNLDAMPAAERAAIGRQASAVLDGFGESDSTASDQLPLFALPG